MLIYRFRVVFSMKFIFFILKRIVINLIIVKYKISNGLIILMLM